MSREGERMKQSDDESDGYESNDPSVSQQSIQEESQEDDFQHFQENYPGFINIEYVNLEQEGFSLQKKVNKIFTFQDIDEIVRLFSQKQQKEKFDKQKIRKQKQKKIAPFVSAVNLQKLQRMKKLFEQYENKNMKMNFNQISKELMLGQRTIYRYWKQYKKDPTLKDKQIHIKNNKNTLRICKKEQQITIRRTQIILKLMKIHRKWTIDQLTKILNKNLTLIKNQKGKIMEVQNFNVGSILRNQGYKRMRVKKQLKSIKNVEYFTQRRKFCETFMQNHNKAIPAYYYFIKQIDLYFKRVYGWYKKGQDIQDDGQLKINKDGLFLTSFGGFQYPILWKIEQETITPELYILKLLSYINHLDQRKVSIPKMLICQRNQILFRQDILEILKKFNFRLLFLPQKDYNLNPLQLWFNTLKLALFKVDFKNLSQIKLLIQNFDTEYIDSISDFLKKCLSYIQKTLQNDISRHIN